MSKIETLSGSENMEIAQNGKPSHKEGSSSTLKKATKIATAAIVPALVALGLRIHGDSGVSAINTQELAKPTSGQEEILPQNSPLAPSFNNSLLNFDNPVNKAEVKAALSFSETIAPLLLTREQLEQNPQNIKETKSVVDGSGNMAKQYVLHENGYVYETHLDQAGKFTEYRVTSVEKVPLAGISSLGVSPDGSVVIAGGEDPKFSGHTGLAISYDAGFTWKKLDFPSAKGTAFGITYIEGTGNKYLVNQAGFENDPGMSILTIGSSGQNQQLSEVLMASNIPLRATGEENIVSIVDNSNHKIRFVSTMNGVENGIHISEIDYETAQGTSEHIGQITIDGNPWGLGTVSGNGQYIDNSSHRHLLTGDGNQLLYNIDLDTANKTATKTNYTTWLNNRGIPDYVINSLDLEAFIVKTDGSGQRHIWAGGGYTVTSDSSKRSVIIHWVIGTDPSTNPEVLTIYFLDQNQENYISEQENFKSLKINGQTGFEAIVMDLGRVIVPANADGNPNPSAQIIYPDKGLGINNSPFANKTYIPYVSKQ